MNVNIIYRYRIEFGNRSHSVAMHEDAQSAIVMAQQVSRDYGIDVNVFDEGDRDRKIFVIRRENREGVEFVTRYVCGSYAI